ncbi:hypothetical protein GGS20DRAFT_374477 [Poronia punctata]|nr:hypothetical protein GGS20DRAFT_374477 [Poronia punctata]
MEEEKGVRCSSFLAGKKTFGADGSKSEVEWKSLDVSLDGLIVDVRRLSSNHDHDHVDIVDVLEVLWAVLLREDTGSDQVAFDRIVHGVGQDQNVASRVLMNLDRDDELLPSISHRHSLKSLIAARADAHADGGGARAPFAIRQHTSDDASCDTAIWITREGAHVKHPSSCLAFADYDAIIKVEREQGVDGKTGAVAASLWYPSPHITARQAHNIHSTLRQGMRCLPSSYTDDIRDLDLLSPENKEDLRRWMGRGAWSRELGTLSLSDLLRRAAGAHADAPAIQDADGLWTYGEFEEACHSSALYLRERGVEHGDMVLLLREKSRLTVAAMIATLKLGAICVPVDIRQPKERVDRIIRSTGARFILTSEAIARKGDSWTSASSLQEICLPIISSSSIAPRTTHLPPVPHDSTAFVYFTSGSTGTPKGVVQPHTALALTAEQISFAMRMDESTRTFQYSSYSFDVAVGDIFATILAGGCLCVPSESQRLEELSKTINAMEATHICTTSTILAQMNPRDVPSLRQVTVGGEPLTKEQLKAWHPRIATIYGTTESVIWDTYNADLTPDSSPTNIGSGMGPTTTWIVDPWRAAKLVPIGAVGELLIGGPLLSRGYLNDQVRTRAAFMEQPPWLGEFLGEDEPARLYRTGDLVRYNPDGTIQFLGRKDRQVKINGQRVELGEIEYALRQSFPEGTVCAAETIRPRLLEGQEVLAAFIHIPPHGHGHGHGHGPGPGASSWSLASVRQRLGQLLPMYMIPSLFVPLESGLPTTPTGKMDRTGLRKLGASLSATQVLRHQEDNRIRRDPAGPREMLLQRLYAEALGLSDATLVDMNSNFFQNGGTSIHAIQLVSLARKQGFSFSVVDVFENPLLTDLANRLQPVTGAGTGAGTGEEAGTVAPVAPFSLLPPDMSAEEARGIAASLCGTEPSQVQDVFPCTMLQEGFLALSSKNAGDYVQQAVIKIPGTVGPEQFREAYRRAAARIPILRCRAFALPRANHRIHMAVIDEKEEEWFIGSGVGQCSECCLEQLSSSRLGDRLVRCGLVSEATGEQYFVWTIHHALFDGWSLSLMLDEIERQLAGETQSPLLPFQNFVHYLRNGVDYDGCRSFWRSRLEGAGKTRFPLSIASDYKPSGRVVNLCRSTHHVQWPTTGVTPSVAIQGAWALLLSQHAAAPDVVFGSTFIGRHAALPGIEHIAGPTMTTVPVRVRVQPSQKISKFLEQMQLDVIRTVPYDQYGLTEIAKVSTDAEKACGFQTLLVVQPPEESPGDGNGRTLGRSQVTTLGTLRTYAVILQCWVKGSGAVELEMEVDETVLSRIEGERLLAQFEAIIKRLCNGSMEDEPLAALMSCSDSDMAQISRWNLSRPLPPPRSESVLELITEQVKTRPDNVAVHAWDGSLTYRELDVRSGQLAHELSICTTELRSQSPVVAICLEKSHLAVVALLAVLKAGRACVLIDPSHPSQRIKTMIERSQARLALTDEPRSHLLGQWVRTITLSKRGLPCPASAAPTGFRPFLPTDDACVVFTSGSTGEPKAICWSHQTVAYTALQLGAQFGISSRSRLFQFSSYAFDVSIHETTATLVRGGCVCIPSEQQRQNALQQAIISFNASFIVLTPSVAQVLSPEEMPCLETAVFCGEPLPQHTARKWSERMSVHNWYGPAECSLATSCRVDEAWRAGKIGVGTSTTTWVVNREDDGILQPVGAVGELLLQGPCVASRYANDEPRAAQAFIEPPPWWHQLRPGAPGTRLYKTGDLVRYDGDGSLILLGRQDGQVKVRGQRVELGEIQGRLQELLGADTAVVVDMIGDATAHESQKLVVFVQLLVEDPDRPPKSDHIAPADWTQAIQTQLSERLPSCMIPQVFIIVSQIPRTATAKIDRAKLHALEASLSVEAQAATDSVVDRKLWEPSTEEEAVLGRLWTEVLGISVGRITPNAHFIRLGGNSIDAMRLSAAATEMGYSLSVKDILTTPSLAELSRRIQHGQKTYEDSSAKSATPAPFSLIQESTDLGKARRDTASQSKVKPERVEDLFPCTALQTGLIALTSKRPGDYVSQSMYHIQASLDRFKSSWEQVVAVTPILRTRIVDLGGEDFYQAIIQEPIDWNDTYDSLDRYLEDDQRIPMGLGARLVRWGVVKDKCDEPSSFTFIWTIHHSLYDGWSFRAILEQVESAYSGMPLMQTTPFRDFVQYTTAQEKKPAAGDFWKRMLEGSVAPQFPVLPSPQYQPRATSMAEYRSSLSRRTGTPRADNTDYTLNTMLRAAWSLVLARYCGSTDVVFGVTVLGRQAPVPGVGDMIGPTIATTPFRVRWTGEDTVRGLLQDIHQESIDIIPFEQIGLQKIRRLGPGPEEGCKFQTMLIVQAPKAHKKPKEEEEDQTVARLFDDFIREDSSGLFSSTALVLRCSLPTDEKCKGQNVDDDDDDVCFYLDYDPRLVDEQQARRILGQLDHTLLELMSASADDRIDHLQLLNRSDFDQIMLWNAARPKAVDATVMELFDDVVRRLPHAPAVHGWDAELSYAELDMRAADVAHRLVSLGVRGPDRVPLYFEKSAWTIVAIFGVLKVGGTVVLLEPSQPDERLHFILDRISARVMVTSAKYEESARRLLPSAPVVKVDGGITDSSQPSDVVVRATINSSWPIYVVFTSGSTGVPKGVVVTHGNVCSALENRKSALPYQPGDRVLDGVSYAFDVTWGNILFTLCSGACLCVPPSVDAIAASLNRFAVTVVGTVPSLARVLDPDKYPALKTIIFGGESAHPADIKVWAKRADVFNSYGPAECTVSVCLGRLNDQDRVHVGGGIGATTWIVDDTMGISNDSLASIGSVGELWLEGPQVGLGYLDDPTSTASVFIEGEPAWLSSLPAAFSAKLPARKDRRFYRTGDLAQYYPDGTIRIVGRRDTQAKIRGQRVELEEVEHHVKRHLPRGIEIAAEVIVLRSHPDRQFLIVFVVPDPAGRLSDTDVQALRTKTQAELSQALPTYMCPSAYISLPSLPRLAAGKVNRKQLREIGAMLSIDEVTQPVHPTTDSGRVKTPPRTAMEKRLRELWATTLGLAPCSIGVEDSFLQLDGGDSISVMRLVRLAQENDICFNVVDVYSHPKLEDLATKVRLDKPSEEPIEAFSLWRGPWTVDRLKDEAAVLCDIRPRQIEDIFPCTPLQEGLLALTSGEPSVYSYRQVFELRKGTDISRLQEAWETVVASVPILRTRVVDLHPYGLHQVLVKEKGGWLSEDEQSSFGLGSRLVRWALKNGPAGKQLIWTIHHSLYDGWSIPRVLDQVDRAYHQKPLYSYQPMQPFIRYLSSTDEEASSAFWNTQLAEAPPPSFPQLPSGSYEAKATHGCICHVANVEWPSGIDVTPTAWVRVAWSLLVGHIINTDDIVFGATTSGRQAAVAGIQDIIGPTIATVPVRVQIDWTAPIRDFARQLQRQLTGMIPFEHIGLHRLRHISQDAKHASQFRTLLNVQPVQSEPPLASRLWKIRDDEPQGQFDNFPLILDCELRESGILLRLDFDTHVMQPPQAERLIHQLETILSQLGRKSLDLTKPLTDFNPVSKEDISQIWKWNAVVPEEVHACLHDIIQEHIKQRPYAPAVDAWDGQLNYEQLDEYGTRLASYLQNEHRIGPDIVVALCFEKSMWTVVAALAVMKAGGAFTLMDTTHPVERLRTIVSQVNEDLVISSAPNAGLASRLARQVVVVDHAHLERLPSPQPLRTDVLPSSKLYVVFTSGSTGTPKGAVITHSNFSSAVKHQGAFLDYNQNTRVFDFASYSFDISLSNLLHCLAAGGCLCIPSDVERKHSRLAESMARMRVNLVDLTPSVARTLDPEDVPSLRTLVLGGEAALRSDIERWAPHVRVLNGIGQAECTVTTTMAVMDAALPGTPGIGKALGANTWVVSPTDHNQLAAIGAVGELLVEGPLVGAGYLNDAEKTSAAFIRDPHWLSRPGASGGEPRHGRLYKTGDLVRYDTDGGLQFIGRKDAQTKIRGQRIELEEVEYHVQRLLSSMSIKASVAAEALVLTKAAIRNAVLVVFVCTAASTDKAEGPTDGLGLLDGDPTSFPQHLRQELSSRLESELPSAMVPFVYIPVKRIPLSPTGKTDRKRLKAFGASLTTDELAKLRGVDSKPKRAPSTPSEHQIRDLWAEILGIPADDIGVDDNFVQLGGDSISAMRLVSIARGRGLVLHPKKLMRSGSALCDLAVTATAVCAGNPTTGQDELPFRQLDTEDVAGFLEAHVAPHIKYPVSNIVDAFPVNDFQADSVKAAVQRHHLPSLWNYIYIDFQLSHVSVDLLRAACLGVAMHFPILRTVFVPYGDSYLQIVTKDWVPEMVELNSTTEDVTAASERFAREDWQAVKPTLGTRFVKFMLVLADNEPERARLLIRMSHALYDGTTLGPLLQAMAAAIDQRPLPAFGSFASFIQHSTSMKDEASRYWRQLLSGSSLTKLPAGTEPDDVKSSMPYMIKRRAVRCPSALPSGVTVATFCTACWAAVLASITRESDVVFGRLVTGRAATMDVIPEPVAGPCLNIIPLRVSWATGDEKATYSPLKVVDAVQQQQVDGMAFESTRLAQIKGCMDWPASATWGSVFLFQNVGEDNNATVSGTKVELDIIPMEFRPEQLWLTVIPRGQDLDVALFGTTAIMPRERAELVVNQFIRYAQTGGR